MAESFISIAQFLHLSSYVGAAGNFLDELAVLEIGKPVITGTTYGHRKTA